MGTVSKILRLIIVSVVAALPSTFLSLTVAWGHIYDDFSYPSFWIIVAQGLIWYSVCGFISSLLMTYLLRRKSGSMLRKLGYIFVAIIVVSACLSDISTTFYQTIGYGHFVSIGNFPHSWVLFMRAMRWYFLSGLLSCIIALLMIVKMEIASGHRVSND